MKTNSEIGRTNWGVKVNAECTDQLEKNIFKARKKIILKVPNQVWRPTWSTSRGGDRFLTERAKGYLPGRTVGRKGNGQGRCGKKKKKKKGGGKKDPVQLKFPKRRPKGSGIICRPGKGGKL